jgi:TRAP-type C4-dicarboxylate transport system permease small subunit
MEVTSDPQPRFRSEPWLRAYLALTRRVVIAISIAALARMVAVNGLEIVGRALFQRSFSWVQEVSIIAAMWVYFLAYALVAKDEDYIRVDLVMNFCGAATRRRMSVIVRLITIAFHATVTWYAVETWRFLSLFTTSVLDWPESIFVLPLLIGCADIAITETIYLYWQLAGVPVATAHRAEAAPR